MRRMLFLMALLVGCMPLAFAQQSRPDEYPKFEWFAGYTPLGDANQDNGKILTFFGTNTGFETSLTRNLMSRRWGIKGDFSSHSALTAGAVVSASPLLKLQSSTAITNSSTAYSISWSGRNSKRGITAG